MRDATFATIREQVANSRRRLRSLDVEYVVRGKGLRDPDKNRSYTAVHLQARSSKRVAEYRHASGGLGIDLDLRPVRVFYSESAILSLNLVTHYLEQSRKIARELASYKSRAEIYMECTSWWPPDDTSAAPRKAAAPPDKSEPYFLHEALVQPGYTISADMKMVDDHPCWLIERPGLDKIWIDPSVGYQIRRREWYFGTPAVISSIYTCGDFAETESGWLPRRASRLLFDLREPTHSDRPPILNESHLVVSSVRVNSVPDRAFEYVPEPGTLIENKDTGTLTQVPGGIAVLDDILAIAGARMETLASTRAGQRSPQSSVERPFSEYQIVLPILGIEIASISVGLWRGGWFTNLGRSKRPFFNRTVTLDPSQASSRSVP
jgi:hypothetical protein